MTITPKLDLRSMFGPTRDQGPRPTCLAFATSDTHAALRGQWAALSCEFAYYHAQRRGKRGPHEGATLPTILDAVREDGQPEERGWPYLASVTGDVSQWTPPSGAAPLYRRNGAAGGATFEALLAQLGSGIPVITLMRLSASFFKVGPDGLIDEKPGEQPDFHRRHAVIAVGHGDADGQRVVLIRNSWGPKWGAGGYGWVTERYMRPRIFRIAILKEDVSVSACNNAA